MLDKIFYVAGFLLYCTGFGTYVYLRIWGDLVVSTADTLILAMLIGIFLQMVAKSDT